MRNGLIAAIIAVTVGLGIGAIFAGYHGTRSEMAATQGALTEGRAATGAIPSTIPNPGPSNPGDYAPPAQPAPPNEGEPGPTTIR